MLDNMHAVVGVVVDNWVLLTTLVIVLVSVSVLLLCSRKPQAIASEIADDEFLVDDQRRTKKSAKSKPKKSKAEKV